MVLFNAKAQGGKGAKIFCLFLMLILLVVGCVEAKTAETPVPPEPSPTAAEPTVEPTAAQIEEATAEITPTPSPTATDNNASSDTTVQLTILYTNDEHGWMEGVEAGEGAANLINRWRDVEGYTPDGPFLILSGGDMWTGPAISTWFEGQSMAQVMNEMGYAAAAVGNHEFDFGLDALQARSEESNFPFLSANIRYKSNGETPTDLGIEPYSIVEAGGIQVGIIGLTTTSTPFTTNPVNVIEFDFLDYETALREVVPQVQEAGAELILVPGHICHEELVTLAEAVGDLGVHMLGGGHCNELFAEEVNGIVILEGGYHFTSYARATFEFDTATDSVVSADYAINFNTGSTADSQVDDVVMMWREEADVELDQVIGYTEAGIPRRGPEMENLITASWLANYPADVAVTNLGGIRTDILAGEITLGDIIGVMPFNNIIVELELTGEELFTLIERNNLATAGVYRIGVNWHLTTTDEQVLRDDTYRVLVNDFMYAGGDGLSFLAVFDPEAYNTAIEWRQPVIDWILAQESTPDNPIDAAVLSLIP
jgi:2',3'-cyclic-nucleotide 2'-phosphodiesterase (5'-nucleotidase family)